MNLEIYNATVYHETILTLWLHIMSTFQLLCFTVEILESGDRKQALVQCTYSNHKANSPVVGGLIVTK